MRWPKAMIGPVCLWSPRLLSGVGACFILVGISKRLPTWTTCFVWSGTLRKLSVESVWRIDRVFPCMVYIDSNHHDSRISVLLIYGSHYIDNLTNLMSLVVIDVVLLLYT
jgi:hypothetical protein